jgi:hypothetical protein
MEARSGRYILASQLNNLGISNMIGSFFNFYLIRDAVKRRRSAVSSITLLAALGSLWGIATVFINHGWIQFLMIPFYSLLGVLVQVNKERFINN